MINLYIYFTDEEYVTLRMNDDQAEKVKKQIQKDGFFGTVITYEEKLVNCSLAREMNFIKVSE